MICEIGVSSSSSLLVGPCRKAPKAKNEDRKRAHIDGIERERYTDGRPGRVTLFKMPMRQTIPLRPGVSNVFPNRRHKTHPDGLGCHTLSPMVLGPVEHNEHGLPPAKNIENYYQYAKVYPDEYNAATEQITPRFWVTLAKGYNDAEPHRRKENRKRTEKPLFSVRRDANGEEHRYTYAKSRIFYCAQYEKLARQQKQFDTLVKMRQDGYHLCLCGYDANACISSETQSLEEELMRLYLSEAKPFGHEMVLFTMLCVVDPRMYPWNRA